MPMAAARRVMGGGGRKLWLCGALGGTISMSPPSQALQHKARGLNLKGHELCHRRNSHLRRPFAYDPNVY